MVDVAKKQEREMRVAVERVVGFAQEFGEAHLNLACHAAFPLSLTPDLLYQIWANFVPETPWTAVARVLLSRLCNEVGSEIYEMENSVRNLLLRELKVQFGQERFDLLGEFLLEYVGQRLTDDDVDTQDLRQAQEWTALAYTKPEEAARELAQALSDKVQHEDIGEVLRLSSLVETLSEPLVEAGFEPLLIYKRGIKYFFSGNLKASQIELSSLVKNQNKIYIAGIRLNIPLNLNLIFCTLTSGSRIGRIYNNHRKYGKSIDFRYFRAIGPFDHHRDSPNNPQKDEKRGVYHAAPIFDSSNDWISSCLVSAFGDRRKIKIDGFALCIVEITRELNLLDLRENGALKARSVAFPHAPFRELPTDTNNVYISQGWSRYFYENNNLYSKVDGLIYHNRYNNKPLIVLYERAENALKLVAELPFNDSRLLPVIEELARENALLLDLQ